MENLTGLAILAIFPLCMIFATFYDVLTMTIPNKISLILIASFLVLAPLAGISWQAMLLSFGVAFLVLVVGYVLFSIGQMGAGDVKLMASSVLWFGAASTSLTYLMLATIMGGVLTTVIWFGRRQNLPYEVLNWPWLNRLMDKNLGCPYGAALGPAALIVFSNSPWMEFVSGGVPLN